jgi:hypothetical protein
MEITLTILLALVAVLAFSGWAATLYFWTTSKLDEANTLAIQLKINKQIDDTIANVVARLKPRTPQTPNDTDERPTGRASLSDEDAARIDAIRKNGLRRSDPFQYTGDDAPADRAAVNPTDMPESNDVEVVSV